jgi:hypothetical protein
MLNLTYNYFFLFFVIYLTLKTNNRYFNFDNLVYFLCLIFHLSLTFIYTKIFKIGDWDNYIQVPYIGFNLGEFSTALFFSTALVQTFSFLLSKLLFINVVNEILLYSLFSFFGILLFVKNLIKLGFEKKNAYFLLFIPSIHFWTGIPGKDSLILFFLSCFFHLYIDRKILYSIVTLLIVFLIRPHIGAIFLFSVVIIEGISLKEFYKKLNLVFVSSITFYLLLTAKRTKGFFLSAENIDSNNVFTQLSNQLWIIANKYTVAGSTYEAGNLLSNVFSYVLFPIEFLFKSNTQFLNILIIIEIFSLIFIFFLFVKNSKTVRIDKKLIYFLSICLMIYLFSVPQLLFNYGINVRQKWMILPFLIYFSFLLKNLFVKINKI